MILIQGKLFESPLRPISLSIRWNIRFIRMIILNVADLSQIFISCGIFGGVASK